MNTLANRLWRFFTSLRLTVVCLALSIVLIWIGTVAQADEGLFQAQTRYFRQWIVLGATLWGHRVPVVLPGGYLLGVVLLVNLIAAHLKRFQWSRKKVGIHLTHAGIVLLLVGQLATDMFSEETNLRFREGETKGFTEAPRTHELALIREKADREEVVVVPESLLARHQEIRDPKLPWTIHVKNYVVNSEVMTHAAVLEAAGKLRTALATVEGQYASAQGLAAQAARARENEGRIAVWRAALAAVGENEASDLEAAAQRIAAQPERAARLQAELKTRFQTEMLARFRQQGGAMQYAAEHLAKKEAITPESLTASASSGVGPGILMIPESETKEMDKSNLPSAIIELNASGKTLGTWIVSAWLDDQGFTYAGEEWRLSLRPARVYQPFMVSLLKTTHDVYPGTEIPKNFQSRVRVENPASGENREVDISMNNPLRYQGLTFFQSQMGTAELGEGSVGTSTLQVVRNPSWLAPYLGCALVGVGMAWQFLFHLAGFIRKRTATAATV